MKTNLHILILWVVFTLSGNFNQYKAQCNPGVPSFNVNLTGNPDSVWNSPPVVRNDNCCGTTNPDRCVRFEVILDPLAVGISFNIVEGAIPPGALFYQVNCGPPQALGSAICLEGVGPHIITFCKPGNNNNVYQITSIPAAVGGTNVTINDGCTGPISATGFVQSTVTWTSVFPGAPGTYNNYLSCTSGCLNPTVTASGTPPTYVDYMVCGQPLANCNFQTICDTVRVTFNPTLNVTIVPINPTICFGQTSTTLTAIGSGGTPPYTYLWNNVNPSQTNIVGAGTFTVMMSDASNCPPTFATVTVTIFTNPITADAGPDMTICNQIPTATLNGVVTGASGGIWSGGAGTFSPNNTTLTGVTYTPTSTELSNGFVDLILTTTGNGTCPLDADTVRINYIGFTGTVSTTTSNVSCFGANNGSATVTITGGIPTFTYNWTTVPVQTNNTATNLSPGNYTVTIQNGIGCTTLTTVAITEPLPLTLGSSTTPVSCNGGNNGTVNVVASGGTTPYTYLWSPNGQTIPNLTGQVAGNYTATVTDANGCVQNITDTIIEPLPIIISFTKTDVSCFNGNNGTITASVVGGTAPYTYSWSPSGGTGVTAAGLIAGTYTLTVTDNHGCIANNIITINQPTQLAATTSATNVTCNGLSNGSASVTVNGGTTPYTYSWSPSGGTGTTASNLAAGNYSVTVTDSLGCQIVVFATITEPLPLIISTNQINVSCFGGNNGSAIVLPSGGTPNYSYLWSPNGSTSATATNLSIGNQTVTVTDNNGCQIQTTVTITEPPLLVLSTVSTPVSCPNGSNGTLTVNAVGGVNPYTYLWFPNGQTTTSISGQPAGNYSVNVTDSNGCVQTINATITEPLPIVITFNSTNVSCFNGNNGVATANVVGGTMPYTYSWSPSGGSGSTASNLVAGTYTVTITDANGCLANNSIVITQPSPLVATTTSTNETCTNLNNGTATVIPSGGTAPYTYVWSPSGGTGSTATNLAAGNYSVTVTDNLGCQIINSVVITEPLPLLVSANQMNVSCFGGNDGVAVAIPSGGTPNYTYSWSPSGSTSNQAQNLTAGNHTVTVTDANGCQNNFTVTITQPTQLTATLTPTSPTCYGYANGGVSAAVAGGTAPYSYLWMPGNYTTQNVSNLVAGTYTVFISDTNGCLYTNSVVVTNPAQIVLVTSSQNASCGLPNGEAYVTITSGGVSPFTYLWSPTGGTADTAIGLYSGIYVVVVTDANGCTASAVGTINDAAAPVILFSSSINVTCNAGSDGSASVTLLGGVGPFTYLWSPSGDTLPSATGLSAGTHYITVTGSNGCSSSASTIITEPTALSATVATTPVSCFSGSNGTATISAFGGTPNYTFTWLSSGTTGSSIANLSAGLDSVRVTDDNGCILVTYFTVNQPNAALNSILSSTPVSCFGGFNGTVSAVSSGGTPPYSYNWMPGNLSGASLSNLPAGTYTVTVTDIKSCPFAASVTVTEPTIISLITSSINANCGQADGQATVVASGGTGTYSYSWSPFGGTNSTATGLVAGNYSVTVTDSNGCSSIGTVTVNDTPGPVASIFSTTNVSCYGGSDGTATVGVSGGTSPFTYLWSPLGGTGATATNLSVGFYTVVVTDSNGCQSTPTLTPLITQPNPILATVSTTNVSCFGGNDGTATINAFGGTPSYTFTWLTTGATGSSISNLSAGLDSVRVTDDNGCISIFPYTITQPAVLTANIISSTNVSCFGGSNGTATVSVAGGTPFYSYQWLPTGGNNATATGLSAGNYTVNITDSKGCLTSTNIIITEPAIALSATSSTSPNSCFGGSNGTATVTPSGGTPNYFYSWSPIGGTSQTATGLPIGNYVVTVTDLNNCTTYTSVTISQPTAIQGTLATINPSCGLPNGTITSQITGGTPPYSYLWSPGGAITSSINGLAAGNYSLQVTDAANCTFVLDTTLTPIPTPIVAVTNATNVSCFNGSDGTATATINAGTPPYSINWSPFGGTNLTATGLFAGTYFVSVTDGLGCIATDSIIITQPTPVTLTATSTMVSCNGGNDGQITALANGGTPNYTYTWSPVLPVGATVSNLSAGVYQAIVTDQNNCSTSISVTITAPTALTSSVSSTTNPTCSTSDNGTASVTTSGGTVPYSYLWSNGQTGSTATNLIGGAYTVVVTDAKGCTVTVNTTITQPAPITSIAGLNDTICLGQSAVVSATAIGGAGNYSYGWQPVGVTNSGTLNVSPTTNTTYTVIAFDQNGCPGSMDTVEVIVYDLQSNDVEITATETMICPGQSIVLYAQQNSTAGGPLTFSWNNGLGSSPGPHVVTPSVPTSYIVTVTNSCGVTIKDTVYINFNPPPTVLFNAPVSSCFLSAVQFIDNSTSGNPNDQLVSWLWNFGDGGTSTNQNPTHLYPQIGNYSVTLTVTTANGCTNTGVSPVGVQILPSPTAAFSVNSTLFYLPTESLVTTNQSTGANSYFWTFGDGGTSTQTNPTYLYNLVGNFEIELTATNQYGCKDVAIKNVTTTADVVFPNAFTPGNPSGGFYDINDLSNDIFFPYTSGVVEYQFEIFNRWGELIFATTNIKQGWDGYYKGEIVQQGVYVWKAYLKLNNGKEFNKAGDVTVLR
jgi:PKD repeat protein